jgi:hypothetical protein
MAAETHKMLKEAFGDNALGQTPTYEWFKCFKNGWMSVDEECCEPPSTGTTTENVAKVQEAILEDQRRMIHDVCNVVGLLYGTCHRILSDELNKGRIAAKSVPRLMSSDQKELCTAVCTELKEQAENIISNIITGDECSVFGYDPEMKQQSSQWKTPTSL